MAEVKENKTLEPLKVTHVPQSQDDIQVGDIFHSGWGATMMLNTYWKVVARTAKTVTLRTLRKVTVSGDGMSGKEMPVDEFEDYSNVYDKTRFVDTDGKVYSQVKRMLDKAGRMSIKVESFMYAYPWNGEANGYDHWD